MFTYGWSNVSSLRSVVLDYQTPSTGTWQSSPSVAPAWSSGLASGTFDIKAFMSEFQKSDAPSRITGSGVNKWSGMALLSLFVAWLCMV